MKRLLNLVIIGLLIFTSACQAAPTPTAQPIAPTAVPLTTIPPTSVPPTVAPMAIPPATASTLVIAPDIEARAAKLKPIEVTKNLDLSGLVDWERAVLDKLIQAGRLMDAGYWQQSDPVGEKIYRELATATEPKLVAARFMLGVNFGRWDKFDEFKPFVGTEKRPTGVGLFPADLTKEELDAYIAKHPDEKAALLSSYTVVRRDGDKLIAVPYHEAYAEFMLPAAKLLDEAAALSQNASLKKFLALRAEALRTDDYYQADLAWLDLDANIDLTMGPIENADDLLTAQKTSFQSTVQVVDHAASARLAGFKNAVPDLQANLPVPDAFKPSQADTLTPIVIVNDLYRSGQMRSANQYVAYSLPNDPRVWAAKGVKKVIAFNWLEARRLTVLQPLAAVVLDDANAMTADGYFNWLLMHEVSHSLGPGIIKINGEEQTVRQALSATYTPIEEGKADIAGLFNLPWLQEHGIIKDSLKAHYVGYLSEALRAIRFGSASAYGVIRSAAWNWFVEKGALALNPATGRYALNVDKMTAAAKDLATTLITIEGNGDPKAAQAFIDQYSYVSPELKKLLDKANETVPVEFVPVLPANPITPVAATAAPTSTEKIPLKDALATLQPQAVWTNFYNLTQVPRPSHHEAQATAFVAKFGTDLGLETSVDEAGNVIIRKPATKGYEDRPGVVLQAHLDMVPQKTADKVHDFEKDPIEAYVEGDWVKADRTTLGGDDGIGVALIMTLLQDDQIAHGPIEALFTTDEEDGFDGVNGLSADVLQGRYFINVDSETEGTFGIGSAGGVYVDGAAKYAEDAAPADTAGYRVTINGLQGGHSGVDINKGRGSASKLLVRTLWWAWPFGVRVSTLSGGDRANAIPRDATADVIVPQAQAADFEKFVKDYETIFKSEYAAVEPTLALSASPIDRPAKVMSAAAQTAFLAAIYGVIVGTQRMSDSVPGLVETSDSMGILKAGAGEWSVNFYVRSAVDSARDDTAQKIIAVLQLAGAQANTRGAYSGWRPNIDSPLLKLMQGVYKQEFGTAAVLEAVHAGLETSVVGAKYPSMDMISLGPTLIGVHSPDERLEVATVAKVYDLLVAALKQIPAK